MTKAPDGSNDNTRAAPVASLARVGLSYGKTRALDDVSLDIPPGIMVGLIALFPAWILWLPNAIWKSFDLFIGLIQAFIFALLTILYFGQSMELDHDHDSHDDSKHDSDESKKDADKSAAAAH